jgi:hypothetical protein
VEQRRKKRTTEASRISRSREQQDNKRAAGNRRSNRTGQGATEHGNSKEQQNNRTGATDMGSRTTDRNNGTGNRGEQQNRQQQNRISKVAITSNSSSSGSVPLLAVNIV